MTEEHDEIDEYISELVENGFFVWVGMEPDGDMTLKFGENAAEIDPELYAALMKQYEAEAEEALMGLLQKGLVDVEYDENLVATFKLTEKGQEVAEYLQDLL